MKIISTKVHGLMDFLMAGLLMASPWLLDFNYNGPETVIPVILGLGVLIYSVCTNYEAGLVHKIPMTTHLWLDGMGGVLLAASPWLFGFSELVYMPHLVLGVIEVGTALMTRTVPVKASL